MIHCGMHNDVEWGVQQAAVTDELVTGPSDPHVQTVITGE